MIGNLLGLTFMNSLVLDVNAKDVNNLFSRINIKENDKFVKDIRIELELTKRNVQRLRIIKDKFENKLTRDIASVIIKRSDLLSLYLNFSSLDNSDKIKILNADIQYILSCDCSKINTIINNKMNDSYSQIKFKDLIREDYNTIKYIESLDIKSEEIKYLDLKTLSMNIYGYREFDGEIVLTKEISQLEFEKAIKEFEDNDIYGLTMFQREIETYISSKLLLNTYDKTISTINKSSFTYVYLKELIEELYDSTIGLGCDI